MTSESPSSRNVRLTPPDNSTGSVPFQLISNRLPRWCFPGPEMVPDPKRSPTFMAQPDEAWCTNCCTDDQYMYLKLVRQIPAASFMPPARRATSSCRSKLFGCVCCRYGSGAGSCTGPCSRNGSSASRVTIHGLIEVANALAWNGPSGTYSHCWISRALQSLSSTKPKIIASACCSVSISPIFDGCPTTKPISSSKSSRLQAPKLGTSAVGGFNCPRGRRTLVPLTTTVEARPL